MSGSVVHVVLTDSFAGTEQMVATSARGLAARGWKVTVVGGAQGPMRATLGPGVAHYPAHTVTEGMRRLAAVGRPDLVHAHLTAAEVAALAAKPIHRAPVVATRHIAARRGSRLAGRLVAPLVRRGLTLQIAPSAFVAEVVSEDCTVLPNAVDSQALPEKPRERTVLVLQRFEPEKATEVAVAAWASSGLAADGWRLALAGGGRDEPALRRQVERLGIAASVDFLGWVSDPAELLNRSGILLSAATAEPFGLSVAQAMAVGLPVVASAGGAHSEVLGDSGVTFPVGDHRAACVQLRALAQDGGRRRRYGCELQQVQRNRFALDPHLDGLECLYATVLRL